MILGQNKLDLLLVTEADHLSQYSQDSNQQIPHLTAQLATKQTQFPKLYHLCPCCKNIHQTHIQYHQLLYNSIEMDPRPQNIPCPQHSNPLQDHLTLYLNQQLLSSCLFDYYVQLRSDALPALSALPEQFTKIQKQIITVVQLRKNMQKSIEVQALQSQHFDTILHLVEQKLKMEQNIDKMAQQLKQLESTHINNLLSLQKQQNNINSINQNQIISKSHELLAQIANFKRFVSTIMPNHNHFINFSIQHKVQEQQHYIQQIFKEQRQKWSHTKFIYGIKFNELNLRQELIEQREAAFRDYERSNSELIEVLLRQKQRDKNLRKKDKQKFEEMLKMSHEIDISNEQLSHSERTLNSHYEVELLRIKDQLSQQQQRHTEEVRQLNKIIEQISKQLADGGIDKQQQRQSIQEKISTLNEELSEIKRQNKLAIKQKEQIHSQLNAQIKLNTQLNLQYQMLNKQKLQLKLTHDSLASKNEQLLTQLNEAVLKNSQNTHIKTQLNQKIEASLKNIQQLQLQNQNYKKELHSINSLHQNSLHQISQLQTKLNNIEKKRKQQAISLFQKDQYIKQCESKLTYLQNQLTDIFITHNQQTKILQQQLYHKCNLITLLNQKIAQQQHQILQQEKSNSPISLQQSTLQALKIQVMAQLQRSDHIKNALIDQMVERLGRIIS